MGFCLLPRRAMARRGLIAALLRPTQPQSFPAPPFHILSRSYSNKLFVGGLSFRTDEDAVRRAFAQHGEVVEVKLISDRESGRPKGFGFVTFQSEADAETARSKMTGQVLDGRVIRVDKATSSRPPLPSSSYGGSGSGVGGFSGMSSSPLSSSLPPVAEDWGSIPSNIVNIGAGASSSNPAAPAASSTGFGTDAAKPFESSTFGQAAASWPASTPIPPSSTGAQTSGFDSSTFGSATSFNSNSGQAAASWPASTPAPPNSTSAQTSGFDSSTFGSATSFNSSSFGSATSFNSSTFGSASPASSSGSGTAWPGGTPAPPISTPAAVSSIPASGSNVNNVNAQSSSSNTGSFGSAVPAPAAPDATKSFDSTTFSATSFNSGTFGSALPSASAFGSASVSTNTSTVNASSTTVTSSSSSTASNSIPEAIIIESNTTTVTSNTSTIASTATSGTADASKPLESGTTAASTTTAPSPPSAHPLNSPALTSSGTFDFSNFSFNSSSYRDNDPPLPRRRPRPRARPASQSMSSDLNFNSSSSSLLESRSPFGSNNQFAETSIPKPKGTEMDFGLLNITAPCPPGLRPQGVFDIYLPDDLPEIPPPEPKPKPKPMSLSMFPHRQLPALDLPYHTPEADNWSEIGEDPPKYDLSTLFPSMGELIKKDKEFHWDPFDFDPEATLPPEEEVIVIDSDYD